MTATGFDQEVGYQLSPQQQAAYLRFGAQDRAERRVRTGALVTSDELADRMRALVDVNEILRTRYAAVNGLRMPVQVIEEAGEVSAEPRSDGATLLRCGELTVEHRTAADGTRLVLELPRLSVDEPTWDLLAAALLQPATTEHAEDAYEPLQYADVAAWLSEQLNASAVTAEPDETRHTTLPFLLPEGGTPAASIEVTPVDAVRLQERAAGLGVGEAAILLAAWHAVAARYTGGGEHTALVVTSGRAAPGLAGVLGLLERPVPVELNLDPAAPFAAAVKTAAGALHAAEQDENRHDPQKLTGRVTLAFRYRQAVVVEPDPLVPVAGAGLLHLDCVGSPGGLTVTIAATDARVSVADLSDLAEALRHALADAVADPYRAVDVLRLAAPAEPVTGQATYEPVLHRFLRHAAQTPHRIATRSGGRTLTYGELCHQARAVAVALRERNAGAGALVPVVTPASHQTLAAMLGTWLAGAAFVPIEPSWPADRIAAIIEQLDAPFVVVPDAAIGTVLPVPTVRVPEPGAEPADEAALPPTDGTAYVIFTSGTSGRPKGVVIGHRQLAHYSTAVWQRLSLDADTEFAAVSTLAADLAYTAIFPTLAAGACVRLIDTTDATSPQALADELRRHPVTAMKLVPSHLSALLADSPDPAALLPAKVLVLGGEPLPLPLAGLLGRAVPHVRVYNHYGPTETTIGASCQPVGAEIDARCATVPVGTGLGENILTVVDGAGNPLPPWCPGEVMISGPGVGTGYLDSGFGARGPDGGYRSGDVGRLVPGCGVEILGRLDDQVKLRGYRVQLGEIEGLLRGEPGIVAAAVVARTDESGLVTHLDAYVVRNQSGVDDLPAVLRRYLPPALVPTGWQRLPQLPLTSNGKIDRAALTPIVARSAGAGRPRDPYEQRLMVLWADVLGVDGFSPEDDFFDLGGQSLRAIKLLSRVNSAFGCRLPMSSIFVARSVAAMAALIREGGSHDSHLVPLRRGADGAPVFCLHPGGGSTLSYWELARRLGDRHPVVGVESAGLHGRDPDENFTGMAESYAAAIVANSTEPPIIVGWCFGGLMAWETAHALRRAGHPVAKLVLIDCFAPGFELPGDEPEQDVLALATLVERFAWHYELELPPELPDGSAGFEILLAAMREGGHLPPTAGEGDLRRLLDVYTANMTAMQRHVAESPHHPRPDFPVLLVRAEPADLPPDEDRTWGWGDLVGPDLAFAAVTADHHSIMRPPAVVELAANVNEALAPETPAP